MLSLSWDSPHISSNTVHTANTSSTKKSSYEYSQLPSHISHQLIQFIGRPIGCLLPPSIYLPFPPNSTKQIRPPNRRSLLLPVRSLRSPESHHQPFGNRTNMTSTNSWLTAFIFAAQDYNKSKTLCYFNSPPGVTCPRKKANESFIFLALYVPSHNSFHYTKTSANTFIYSIFTFFGMFLEVAALWAYRKENAPTSTNQEKNDGTRAPLDAPVGPAPTTTV